MTLKGLATPRVPLVANLRGYFAEFLNESYLEHLTILWWSTCVGFRYEQLTNSSLYFSWRMVLKYFPLGNLRVPSSGYPDKNADIQHCATLNLPRHTKSFNAN